MKLVPADSKILFQETTPFDFASPPVNPVDLANEMIEFMREKKAVGLSANQVGLPHRVFVMEGEPAWVMFNPRIIDTASEDIELLEGCLTYPDLWLKIKRPEWVRVRFQTPYGETTTKVFGGYHARVIQHEMEHLIGRSYIWKVTPLQFRKAQKIQSKIQKQKVEIKYV